MSLPDTPTLRAMIDACTPGDWRRAYHGTHEVEADPDQRIADCGTVDRAEADAAIMAIAKESAEEVVRLRSRLLAYQSSFDQTLATSEAHIRSEAQAELTEYKRRFKEGYTQ